MIIIEEAPQLLREFGNATGRAQLCPGPLVELQNFIVFAEVRTPLSQADFDKE
jgi:hypothetical protein